MADRRRQLRKQLFERTDVGELARDVQAVLDTIPVWVSKTYEGFYQEPLVLNVGPDEPESIELRRIVNLTTQLPVQCGSLCHFDWKPTQGGAYITSIDGLSPSTAVRYRMIFRITFPSAA